MKTINYVIALLTAMIIFPGSPNAKVQVNLKVNEELIYEWKTNVVSTPSFGSIFNGSQIIRYSLQIDKIEKTKIDFTARILRDVSDFNQTSTSDFQDFGYPQLVKYYQPRSLSDILEETLYRIPFRFELDRTINSIKLINQEEILSQCRAILKSRHYPNKTIEQSLYLLEKKALYNKTKFFLMPFRFIRTNIDIQDTLRDNQTKLLIQKHDNAILEMNGVPDDKISQLNYKIDLQDFLIISSEKKYKFGKVNAAHLFGYQPGSIHEPEEKLILIQKTTIKPKKIIVCGHISNPVSDQVVLYTLNKFTGNDMDSKTVYLDKAGNFRIESRLVDKGLIALVNPNKSQDISSVPILLYATPGDSIYLNTNLKQQKIRFDSYVSNDSIATTWRKFMVPGGIVFSGDRSKEAELLNRFQNLPELLPFEIQNNNLHTGNALTNVTSILEALTQLNQLISDVKKDLSSESTVYLHNELQAWLYTNLFDAHVNDPKSMFPISFNGPTISENMKDFIFNQLDTFNIHRIYNDYGIFSRDLTRTFVGYKSQRLNNTNNMSVRWWLGPGSTSDPEQSFQFCKMVLNGSALYREAANQLYTYSLNIYRENEEGWQSEIDEIFERMIERCNDEEFIQSLQNVLNNKNLWSNPLYLPDVAFFTIERKKVTLHSFISKKPTLFFASTNWSVGIYEMDEAAREYPEFNFVHIDEGSNFDLWKDWNDRAKPVAHKLFLETDSTNLENLFQKNIGKYLVFDRSGKRIGIENELDNAISIAEERLDPKKKKINESVLSSIIIILALLLFFSLTAFLFYKFRMNRRLKKQTQGKRLRELQMAAIRAQMNPHFLFNCLNSVQNLVQQNKNQEAHLYLSDFAGLIRKVLKNSDKEEVSLAEELETLNQYLNLEKLRFDFNYTIEVDDQIDQNLFMLPAMILQPMAENALTHGLQHKTGDKKLSIRISKIENYIQITVEDNGIGFEASKKLKTNSNGIGLRMNEERIKMMKEKYGGNYSFRLVDLTEQGLEGTRIEIVIPEEQ